MSRDRIENLLQECLSAYDAGLSPEEALSPFEEHRAELEPLFRQALSLRVSYAHAPPEEFRSQMREKLLFHAGREVTAALAESPDPAFVQHGRNRLLHAAGAGAQEALRDVPPPRLPFWVNARRRLLEAAAAPRPQPKPAFAAIPMRVGLSAAAFVMAFALAAALYMSGIGSSPRSVNAELAYLEQRTNLLEQNGTALSAGDLVELTRRTNELVQKLSTLPTATSSTSAVAEKLPGLIERQRDLASSITVPDTQAPAIAQAQQQLSQAEVTIRSVVALAATAPSVTPSPAEASATPAPPTATAAPATSTPVPTQAVLPPPLPGQVQIRQLTTDTAFNLRWTEVRTASIRFVVPSTWSIAGGVSTNPSGVAVLSAPVIRFDSPEQPVKAILIAYTQTGQLSVLVGDQLLILRGEGPAGAVVSIPELVQRAPLLAPELSHIAESIQLIGPFPSAPTATPTPSSLPTTATSTATSTATATATPPPASPSPSATATNTPPPSATP